MALLSSQNKLSCINYIKNGNNNIIGTAVGIDIKKIVGTRNVPLVSTGMVAPNGSGLLGRGIGVMPIEIFEQANQELINLTKS